MSEYFIYSFISHFGVIFSHTGKVISFYPEYCLKSPLYNSYYKDENRHPLARVIIRLRLIVEWRIERVPLAVLLLWLKGRIHVSIHSYTEFGYFAIRLLDLNHFWTDLLEKAAVVDEGQGPYTRTGAPV